MCFWPVGQVANPAGPPWRSLPSPCSRDRVATGAGCPRPPRRRRRWEGIRRLPAPPWSPQSPPPHSTPLTSPLSPRSTFPPLPIWRKGRRARLRRPRFAVATVVPAPLRLVLEILRRPLRLPRPRDHAGTTASPPCRLLPPRTSSTSPTIPIAASPPRARFRTTTGPRELTFLP